MNALTLTPVDGEPRIFDLTLAERLGFEYPIDIRKLIKRNQAKLQRFGIIATVAKIHGAAGRPASEFYLNQKQAVWVCMKSETDLAFDVQAEIVRVFDAYLNGDLKPVAVPLPYADPPNRISAELKKRINRRAWRLAPVACSEYRLQMLAIAQSSTLAFIPERWTPSAYLLESKPYLLPQAGREGAL